MRILNMNLDDFWLQRDSRGVVFMGTMNRPYPSHVRFIDSQGNPADVLDESMFLENKWAYIDNDIPTFCYGYKDMKKDKRNLEYNIVHMGLYAPDGTTLVDNMILFLNAEELKKVQVLAVGTVYSQHTTHNLLCDAYIAIPKGVNYAHIDATHCTMFSGLTGRTLDIRAAKNVKLVPVANLRADRRAFVDLYSVISYKMIQRRFKSLQ